VLELCQKHSEVTLALLREHAPGVYSYFSKHDFSWLRSHIVYELDMTCQHQYDQDLLKKLQGAVNRIKKEGDDKRQLTKGFIATVAGLKESHLNYVTQKTPLTKAFLQTVIETRSEWLYRRITMIWQSQKQIGKPLALTDVKREMSIKSNTYVKYRNLIEELINELNGKIE